MRLTSEDLKRFDIVDDIIPEVTGGAHVDPEAQALLVGDAIERQLAELDGLSGDELTQRRYDRFRRLGVFEVH